MFLLSGINFCIQEHFWKIPDIRNKKFLIIETFWPQINSCYQEFLKQYVLQGQVLLPLRKVIPKASYLCAIFHQHCGQACRDVSRHKPLSKTHSCWLPFALERKYANANSELGWQYVSPQPHFISRPSQRFETEIPCAFKRFAKGCQRGEEEGRHYKTCKLSHFSTFVCYALASGRTGYSYCARVVGP